MSEGQKRIAEIHERLQAWAWWHWSLRVGGHYARSSWTLLRVDGGNLAPPVPITVAGEEAGETDQVVAGLAVPYKVAVKSTYLDREGCSMEQIAGKLRMSRQTLHNRLCEADRRIRAELWKRAEARRLAGEREAVLVRVRATETAVEFD